MSKRNVYSKSRKKTFKKRRKSIFRQRWFWNLILALVCIGSVSYLFLKTPYFEIKNIEIQGDEGEIAQKTKEMISHQNFFLLSAVNVSKGIEETFPQVKEVLITKKFPNSIVAQIQKREEFGIFCLEAENQPCFSIAEDGVVFQEAQKTEDKFLIFDSQKTEAKLGEKVVQEDLMKNIKSLKEELQKSQILIKEVEISPLEIKVKTSQGFAIYFSRENPFEIQMEALLGLFNNTLSKEEQTSLQCCIDLRGVKSVDQIGVVYVK